MILELVEKPCFWKQSRLCNVLGFLAFKAIIGMIERIKETMVEKSNG